jgi:hypothetical protein
MKRAFLAALLAGTALSQTAHADHMYVLRGVNAITYRLAWERVLPRTDNKQDKRCTVDRDAWRTNTEFLTNQITKLHLIKSTDQDEQSARLRHTLESLNIDDPAYSETVRKAEAYNWMPTLYLFITTIPLDGGSGCVAEVKAEAEVYVREAKARNTGEQIYGYLSVEVWSRTYWSKGPQSSFNQDVLATSDQLIKEFVNEWTKAQDAPF